MVFRLPYFLGYLPGLPFLRGKAAGDPLHYFLTWNFSNLFFIAGFLFRKFQNFQILNPGLGCDLLRLRPQLLPVLVEAGQHVVDALAIRANHKFFVRIWGKMNLTPRRVD